MLQTNAVKLTTVENRATLDMNAVHRVSGVTWPWAAASPRLYISQSKKPLQ